MHENTRKLSTTSDLLSDSVKKEQKDEKKSQDQKTAKFMNSYKMESDKPFHVFTVECILKEVLTETLADLTYDPDKVPMKAKWAAGLIRQKVKEQEFDRYKLVCIVTIGEKLYQDLSYVVKFLWDAEKDKYAIYTLENMHVYATAMCFGLYYE